MNREKNKKKSNKEDQDFFKKRKWLIISLNLDKIKEKCKFYQEFHQDINRNSEH